MRRGLYSFDMARSSRGHGRTVTRGTVNIFADLGFPDAAERHESESSISAHFGFGGFGPREPPARSLVRRFDASLRSRGAARALATLPLRFGRCAVSAPVAFTYQPAVARASAMIARLDPRDRKSVV